MDKIGEPVELPISLLLYAHAYLDLNHDRKEYTDYIPWTAKATYAAFNGFDEDQAELLFYYTLKIDDVIVAERVKEVERARRKTQPSSTG